MITPEPVRKRSPFRSRTIWTEDPRILFRISRSEGRPRRPPTQPAPNAPTHRRRTMVEPRRHATRIPRSFRPSKPRARLVLSRRRATGLGPDPVARALSRRGRAIAAWPLDGGFARVAGNPKPGGWCMKPWLPPLGALVVAGALTGVTPTMAQPQAPPPPSPARGAPATPAAPAGMEK